MVFQGAIEKLSDEVLVELLEDSKKRATDALELEQSNKYLQDQLTISQIVERELLKRKLATQN